MIELLPFDSFHLVAEFGNVRTYSLLLGIGAFCGGILLLLNHKRTLDEIIERRESDRVVAYETRKFRRRASASTMIACLGCMLAGLYWVTDAKVFAIFIMLILALLLGIFGLALIDLFSVGLHHIATPDQKTQRKMIEDYLREREKLINKVGTQDEEPPTKDSG